MVEEVARNPSHASKIKFKQKSGTLVCDDCALEHLDNLEDLESLKSIYQSKLSLYINLKEKIRLLAKLETNPEEIKNILAQKLEEAYDELIQRIKAHKEAWIQETFTKLYQVELEAKIPNLGELQKEISEIFSNIQEYIKSEEGNAEGILGLKEPEEYAQEIEIIFNLSKAQKELEMTKIDLMFDFASIAEMFEINGPCMKMQGYSGTLLKSEDYEFILSILPQPPKKLKLLYKMKKDGAANSIFHSKCDNQGITLVIAKGENGNVFGGYSGIAWESSKGGQYEGDKESFLFTCRNKYKHTKQTPRHSIYNLTSSGPIFGVHHTLVIGEGEGYCRLRGDCYSMPLGGKCEDYLAGTTDGTTFPIRDYEVFKVKYNV